MIKSFKCEYAEALSKGQRVRQFASMAKVARRKLRQLEIAGRLDDLRVPPGNHLEALKGERAGQYSIRINDQWRVCFFGRMQVQKMWKSLITTEESPL